MKWVWGEGIWGSSRKPIPTLSLISWAPAGCKVRVSSLIAALWRAKLCHVPWMANRSGGTDRGAAERSPLGSGEGHWSHQALGKAAAGKRCQKGGHWSSLGRTSSGLGSRVVGMLEAECAPELCSSSPLPGRVSQERKQLALRLDV